MITLKFDSKKANASFDKWLKERKEDIKKEVYKVATEIESTAKIKAPVFEGTLRASINIKRIKDGFAAQIGSGVLTGKALEYASTVEFGRKPGGFLPYKENSSLYRWVKLKLGIAGKMTEKVAFIIARNISKFGLKPHSYLRYAFLRKYKNLDAGIKKLMKRTK